jgi:low temperature requirement protein LtrA
MKSLIIRGLSGAIFSALLIFAILYGEISFGILFAIITGLAVNEFCNIIAPYKKTTFSTYLAVLGGVYLFFATYGLRLKENKESKISSLDIGTIIHRVVELFIQQIGKCVNQIILTKPVGLVLMKTI